jgi:spore coat polysaccharide biosynthesis protein SpsF
MKIVAIIQARLGSTRLPGKVMLSLCDKPVLGHVVDRVSASKLIEKVIIASTVDNRDDCIEKWCNRNQVDCFRGSENNVVERYLNAALKYKADIIVRITSDCPVIDPNIIDVIIEKFLENNVDYAFLSGDFPDGLDCQVFSIKALLDTYHRAKKKSEFEHVGLHIETNDLGLYKTLPIKLFKDMKHYRWTLDNLEDYHLLVEIFENLYIKNKHFNTADIILLFEKNPKLLKINSQIKRNEGLIKSLEAEE